MKTMTKLSAIAALLSGLLVGNAIAADVEAGIVKQVSSNHVGKAIGMDTPFIGDISIDISDRLAKRQQDQTQTLGAASGITFFEIWDVWSSNQGWDNLQSTSQTSTNKDHGGSGLYVAVLQYGYGNPNNANMNGISRAYEFSEKLCGSTANLHVCNVGETVTGWLYYFNFSGQQSGTFNTSSNSIASPYGYWSDSIYIR